MQKQFLVVSNLIENCNWLRRVKMVGKFLHLIDFQKAPKPVTCVTCLCILQDEDTGILCKGRKSSRRVSFAETYQVK